MSAAVDLVDLITQHAGGSYKRKSRVHGGEYAGPCPFCGGTDRFQIWPGADFPHYWCRLCGAWGGIAKFLVERCNFSWPEAKAAEQEGIDLSATQGREPRNDRRADATPSGVAGAPPLEWQGQALTLARLAQAALWNPEVEPRVLKYLQGKRRGLAPETIKAAGLGYIPQDMRFKPEEWGLRSSRDLKEVFIPRGILIPYQSDGQLWRLKVRRLTDDKQSRFLDVAGGSNALYIAGELDYGTRTTLSESEFDALVARQQYPEAAHCATGGTNGARETRWLGKLALCSSVLITFDPDGGGDERAPWWVQRLGNAARYRPTGGDLTAMHTSGADLPAFFATGFNRAEAALGCRRAAPVQAPAPEAVRAGATGVAAPVPEQSAGCFFCKAPARLLDREQRLWCDAHAPTGSVDPATGEVLEQARREWSSESGTCYWCGEASAVVDRHKRAWCARHAPGAFDGSEDDEPLPEIEMTDEEVEQGLRRMSSAEIVDVLSAALEEAGARFDQGAAPAAPSEASRPERTGRRALPDAPRCTTPHCDGVRLVPDVLGNLWCRACDPRREMINACAEGLGGQWFPALQWGSTQRLGAGEENALQLARTLSLAAVAMVTRAARGEQSITCSPAARAHAEAMRRRAARKASRRVARARGRALLAQGLRNARRSVTI